MRDSKLPKRKHTEEFKAEAIRLAAPVGGPTRRHAFLACL